ncbi:MAG: hypothetical protein ABJF01_12330 [bacterium]
MRIQFSLLVVSSLLTAACNHPDTSVSPDALNDQRVPLSAASIDIVAEGGFAGLTVHHQVTHDNRAFLYTVRHFCSANCPVPFDSTSGTLAAASADSLFAVIAAQRPLELKDDYGSTHGAADFMDYTMRVTIGGTTKTIRGDDGSIPEPMRRILEAVHASISAASR